MTFLATGRVLGLPMALLVWALLSLAMVFLLGRTVFGRYVYAIGNREAAAYLSGVPTRLVLVAAFALCGLCAGLAGVLLAGYSTKAYQGMGDAYLLPAIAAVVIGGTHILGGRGRYAGTVVGTILITLLSSVLSVMQMPEAGRQIIYGLVIIVMLLAYGGPPGRRLRHRHPGVDPGRSGNGEGSVPPAWAGCRRAARARASWCRGSGRGRTRTASPSRNSGN